ncbi:SemiSWEET family sugar transporter [Streptomyces minutiscleroticus]|uniref:SemiSWEET family sugar transporter n=1 Tax=Streptomyces minutiscleroticus TaxID=68238 RepID=UPI00331A0458
MIVLGLVAGTLTTCCWLPQLLKSWRTRSTADFSWLYLAVFGTGVTLWMIYGLLKRDIAIAMTNTLTLALALGVVGLKVRIDLLPPRGRSRTEISASRSLRPSTLPTDAKDVRNGKTGAVEL